MLAPHLNPPRATAIFTAPLCESRYVNGEIPEAQAWDTPHR